jgi:hypothetical protein
MRNKVRLAILPCNHYEFRNLILKKFQTFLIDIGKTAQSHKGKNVTDFCRAVISQIRARIVNNQLPTDFLIYWNANAATFCQWITMDASTIQKRQWDIMFEHLERFTNIVEKAEINIKKWDKLEHEKETLDTCKTLKELRAKKLIPQSAHNQDLEIISDCLVYRNHFLEIGILYLITNDDCCFKTIKAIICFKNPAGETVFAPGFDCVKPDTLLTKVKTLLSQKSPPS